MNQQTCNPAWLDAFLKNDLNQSEEQMLTSHLDECSDCREELESRAAEQSVWREASNLLGGGTLLSTAAISDIRSGTVRSPQIDLVLQQLAPTDDPESLGRIGGYEVTGVVGAGGMGVVLKAHDRSLDRIVAIKVMSPHLASSGSARRRFAREAKAAAAVLHPNVIAIHSVASEDANPFLVMPYVRGASLQKRVDSQGPLPLKDTLRIGAQIAAGLAAAHEQGLVHRDIKPANILLEEGVERVTITDFGLARAVDDASMTCSGVIAGTPQYMSPEQTRGEPIEARSDLFSLGSVLYAMCAGRSPFRAETTYGVLHRIANDNPTPVCEVNTDVPVWLGHIIERLMAKRPEDRFESAAQVAELLEGCLAHVQQPAAIPLPEAVAALAPIRTRRPPIGKFIAAAAFAFALVFAGVFIVLELNKGTLTILSDADDIRVRITSSGEVINELKVTKSGKSVRVAAGQYKVEVIGETDDLTVENGQLTLHRAGSEVVRIVHQAKTPSEKQTLSKNLNADEWLDKLQGNWNVVQQYIENGVPKRNSYSATVRRNRMEIIPDDGQHSMMFDLVLGEAGPPQQIDLKVVVSDLERQEMLQVFRDINEPPPEAVLNPIFNGIVEFEGNTLRICNHEVPNSPRPIQFTDSSDRVIWNFTRSDRDLSVVPSNDGRLLSEAIRQFNEHQKSDPIGSKQLPLTDDEVIAAVRAMRQEIKDFDISESEYRRLLDAIEHRQIPKEWSITSNNQFQLRDGQIGERWVVQLVLRRSDSSTSASVFRSRYVRLVSEDPKSALPIPEGNVSIAQWLAKVNAPDLNIYAPLPDLPVTEQEIVAALADMIDKDQSIEFAPQRKTLQDIIETRSLPKEAEISVSRPKRLRGYVSRWSNREGFENENWRLRFEYPYMQGEKQIVTAVHLGFRSISSRPVDHVTDDEIHWGPAAQDGLQFGVAIEEVTLHDKSDLASTGAMAYHPHFYFRNPGKTDSTSIQLSDMYQHYEIDARTATGEQLPSKRRQGSYWISSMIFPDTLNGESRIYKRACPFVVGNYAQTLFEDSLSLEPPDGQSFENFPSVAVNTPRDTPLRIRISIPHPLFSDSARLLSGEIRLPSLKLTQTNANTAEDEKAKDEEAKAWLRRPVVGSTHDGKSFQLAGHDALMHCVMTNNSEVLNRLLTIDKYDLDYCPLHGQWTLLQTALQRSCLETTSLLLQHGANPTFASKGTPLPLELAQRSGQKDLVTLVQKYLESNAPHSQTKVIPDTQNELDAKLVPLVSEFADRVALGSIKTLVVEYEISHSRGAPVDLSQIDRSFDTGSLARYSNYPAKLCLDRESGNGFFSGKDVYEFQMARNERISKSLVHCENPVQATLLSPSDVTIRGQYAGYDKRVTNPFFNNRSLEDVLRDLIRGHDFLDEKSPKIWFRIVEDSDSLFRFEVVDHAVLERVGNEIPLQDRERVAATYQVNIDRFQVTLDKRLNWAMTELVRYGCQSGQEGLEHGTAKIGERIFFAEHVLMDGVWLPKSIRRFVGYSDETILVELVVTHLSANAPEQMINTLEFPPGSRVSDDRTISEPAMGLTEKVNVAPLAKLLTTWEEVEARVESIVKEREAILNADVDFKLDYAGNHTSKRRYHVWLNDLNRRSDCRGVSSDGTEDYSTIVTPTFGWFDDHQDKTKSQFYRRDPKDPVGWGTLGCIVDIRKVGLVNWSIESIDTHEFDEDLLPKDRMGTDVKTGDCEGIPITIVKLKRKPDGVAESWTEYWLSPEHGNYPIYIANGWTESENSAEEYIVSQRTQWKFIDGIWFPTSVKHRYLCEQRKMDDIGVYELVKARLNLNPFPNVFDPLEEPGVPDTSRKAAVENLLASEQATELAEKAEVANGEWPPSGFDLTEQQIQRVIGAQSARIVRALDTPVDLVVDGKSSLAEIVSGIVREHRISVRLNEKSFEEQGVAIHHVPAFEVHGVTLKSALTTLLEKLLQHRSIPPVIEVRHGVLTLAAKAPSDTTNDLARSKPTSVVFQSMGPNKQALPETVVEVQGSDGVYFVLSDQNGLAPVVGHGVSNWYTTARDASGQLMAYTSHGMFLSKPTKPYVLNFTAPQLLAVNVSDEHGRPIEGATVGILAERCRYQITDALGRAEFTLPVNNQYVQAIFAIKSGKGLDYISYQPQWATDLPRELSLQLVAARELKVRLLDEQNQPLKGVPIYPVKFDLLNTEEPKAEKSLSWWKLAMGAVNWSATNEQGEVVFDWLPRDQAISFVTTNRELEHNTLNVTDLAEDVVEFRMTGPVKVSGRVLDIDGKPVAGASIAANNESGASANTDEEGRYVLKVRPGSTFYLEAVDSAGGGWMAKRRGISDWVEAVAGQPSKNNDVVIRPTARVFGRVTYTFDSAPAANIQLSYQFHGPAGRDRIEFKPGAFMSRGYGINGYTDDDGRFEFYAVPGKYTVKAVPDSGLRAEQEFAVVGTEPHEANMVISKNIPVKGRVVAGEPPMPMGRVTIQRKHLTDPFGCSGYDWSTNDSGELDQSFRDRDPMILWGHSEDKQLWGVTDMAWDDAEFEMKLAPRAEMKVRILDSDQKPIANTEFTYGIFRRIQPQYQKEEDRQDINVHSIEPREGTTDENGIMKLQDLIAGGDYMIQRTASHFRFERNPDSPIAQAKILVDSMAKDVIVDIILMNIGLDKQAAADSFKLDPTADQK